MGILNNERSHMYPANIRLLPWNDALMDKASEIEKLRQPMIGGWWK